MTTRDPLKVHAYYLAHREEILAYQKSYRVAHPDKIREKNRKRQIAHGYGPRILKTNTCGHPERKHWAKNMCKSCYNMAMYTDKKEIRRASVKKYAARMKAEMLEHYGARCVCCGETEPGFLCIDHINGGGNKHRRTGVGAGPNIYRWLKNHGYPPGFQVLCHNCNMAKSAFGVCPHERRSAA